MPIIEYPGIVIMQGNTIINLAIPEEYYDTSGDFDNEKEKQERLDKIMDIIMRCESGGNANACNADFGCSGGSGLWQIIPTTLQHCEAELGRDLDAFDPEDNKACAYWLAENEGLWHWGTSESWWGSYSCWNPQVELLLAQTSLKDLVLSP